MSKMETNTNKESQLAGRDYYVAIDKSGSMGEPHKSGRTRFEFMQEQVEAVARKCAKWDEDGISVVTLGPSKPKLYDNVKDSGNIIKNIFSENEPSGTTDTAAMLRLVFNGYLDRKAAGNAKPVTLVCFTDGRPDDESAVVREIVGFTKKIQSRNEFGISFVQVGDDTNARAFLQRLDDSLEKEGAAFDIVDCKNEEEMEGITIDNLLELALTD